MSGDATAGMAFRNVPIYILAGQSNAERLGVDAALVDGLESQAGAFELVKYAISSTALAQRSGVDWNPRSHGELYDNLLSAVRERIAYVVAQGYTPVIAGLFWIQGEADAEHDYLANAYFDNLSAFIAQLRFDLSAQMPVVLAGLSAYSHVNFGEPVRQAQARAAAELSHVTLVNTDDLSFLPDGGHYSSDARDVLGHRLAGAVTQAGQTDSFSGYVSLTAPHLFQGTPGNDSLFYRGNDSLHISDDFRDLTVMAGAGDDTVTTGAGDNVVQGEGGDDVVWGWFGDDRIYGGDGKDTLYGSYNQDQFLSPVDPAHPWQLDNDTIDGGAGDDVIDDRVGNNTLLGGDGNDGISAGYGRDRIAGGQGRDTLDGGAGDDTYLIDDIGDVVIELDGGGFDTISAGVGLTLPDFVERLELTGAGNLAGTGNGFDNVLTGNSGANRLDGGSGADTMAGGAGNDVYIVNNAADQVREMAGNGTDTVFAACSWAVGGQYVENLVLTGAGDLTATGNSLPNGLTGNAGNNILDGGTGADTLSGGAGDDSYHIDNIGDRVREVTAMHSDVGGHDTVYAAVRTTLGDFVEDLVLTGSAGLAGSGNALANRLTGNTGDNILVGRGGDDVIDGGAGADTMGGGAGNDSFYVDNLADRVAETQGQGFDTVFSAVSFSLGSAFVEAVVLTGGGNIDIAGNAIANRLTGNGGANRLDGGEGSDILRGGGGADIFAFGLKCGADIISDFSAAAGDRIDLRAWSEVAAGIVITQSGADTVIDLSGGNSITVIGAHRTDVAGHILW